MELIDFKKKLKAGDYAAPVNARRALGRAALSTLDKVAAGKAVNRHFNVGPSVKTSAPKKIAKKASAKRR